MNTRKNVDVSISQLKNAAYNPIGRVADKRIASLLKSIREIGVIVPIIVTPEFEIIEGHRRVIACRRLKIDKIPAVVISGIDPKKIYHNVNTTSAKMNGNDTLGVWLKDPSAVTPRTAKQIAKTEAVVGKKMLRNMYVAGLSTRTYRIACHIVRLCDCESPDAIRKVIQWLIDHSMVGRVMKAIEGGQDPKVIMSAVKKNKPIRMALSIA